jgi:hypothetical protein
MEKLRRDVTIKVILTLFQHGTKIVEGVMANFIFDMDEIGPQDWAEPAEKPCLESAYYAKKHIYIPVSRADKLITLITCIAADDSVLKPEVTIPRKTVDADLVLTVLVYRVSRK